MPTVPLFGIGTQGKSANVSVQKRINLYAEAYGGGADDKSPLVLYSRPGLEPQLMADSGSGVNDPVRAMIPVNRVINAGLSNQQTVEILILVLGGYGSYVSSGLDTRIVSGTPELQTDSGAFVFADDGVQVLGVDGQSAYWAEYSAGNYDLTDIETIPVADFPYGARTICSLAGRFIVDDQTNAGRFRWSGLLDHSDWDPLNYATAETVPDALAGVYAFRGELLLFGSKSLEFWAPTGGTDVFARVGGTAAPWGLVSYQTIQPVDDTLFFVGRRGGEAEVCALSGYGVSIVSTPDVEYDINRNFGGPLSALTLRSGGHSFYVLNMADKTWVYNASVGGWDEWQTDGGRFAGEHSCVVYGRQTVSDYRNSNFYGFDPDAYTDNGEAMLREVQTRHLSADLDRLTLWEVALDVEAGVGLSEGQGSDPQVMLQVSRDGGHTFGNELWQSLGALGQYAKRVIWRRLGRARDFVLRFRVTDAVKVAILGASIRIEK